MQNVMTEIYTHSSIICICAFCFYAALKFILHLLLFGLCFICFIFPINLLNKHELPPMWQAFYQALGTKIKRKKHNSSPWWGEAAVGDIDINKRIALINRCKYLRYKSWLYTDKSTKRKECSSMRGHDKGSWLRPEGLGKFLEKLNMT